MARSEAIRAAAEAGHWVNLGTFRQHLGSRGFEADLGGGLTLGHYVGRLVEHYGDATGLALAPAWSAIFGRCGKTWPLVTTSGAMPAASIRQKGSLNVSDRLTRSELRSSLGAYLGHVRTGGR
jgi:hypothetical protein